MNDLILTTDSDGFSVSGRELHERLEIDTPYHKWFPRMCEYGFTDGVDFNLDKNVRVQAEGGRMVEREIINHMLSLDMAKHLCMIQRTPKGMEVRQYLINIENQWNTPEAVMSRALLMAKEKLSILSGEVKLLSAVNDELKPKAAYCDLILTCPDAVPISVIAKDYGRSAVWLNGWLHEQGIQYKQGEIWLLYADYADQGYTCSRTHNYLHGDGSVHSKIHTYWTQKGRMFLYDLLKQHGILPTMERRIA
ncbi:AntA/AntB antirepressor [Clostridia bacterium]|nr:AntA/AntB antirepressor [Clostridia bacterium]